MAKRSLTKAVGREEEEQLSETWIPESRCRKCNAAQRRATDTSGSRGLRPGDYCVCVECGDVTIMTQELTLRAPTPEEEKIAETDARIAPVLKKIKLMILLRKVGLN